MKAHVNRDLSLQGHYAGPVTRLAAFAIDLGVIFAAFALTSVAVQWMIQLFVDDFDMANYPKVNALLYVLWMFVYWTYPWAVSGRSLGMAIVGIRIVSRDGSPIRARQAVKRILVFPVSFAVFGLGFLGIITRREHQAWHDRFASTAVVYAWDARAARLRFLAKQPAEVPPPDAAPAPASAARAHVG